MNTTILNILCEGPTEEKFVKDVLKPFLLGCGIVTKSQLLYTSRKKEAQGGLISYKQAKNDLSMWMRSVAHRNSETHYFTTMFDLYALPSDFPGMSQYNKISDAYVRVENIEKAFASDINYPYFIPYIQLHEFEALMFCNINKLINEYPNCSKEIDSLENILVRYNGNPELINNNPETAPSKRIIAAIEGKNKYKYNKPVSGAFVTKSIGIEILTSKCVHFGNWIEKLQNIK